MNRDDAVVPARRWATHYDPMGDGAAGVLYGFTSPIVCEDRLDVYRAAPRDRIEALFEQAELDMIDNPLAYPSRHVVDHE